MGYVYYEYTLPLFILYFNSFKMKNYFLLLALMVVFIGLSVISIIDIKTLLSILVLSILAFTSSESVKYFV